MDSTIGIVLIAFLLALTVPGKANISITLIGDRVHADGVECNSSVVVKCKAPPNTRTMTWRLNGNYLADCTFGSCSHLNSFSYGFIFNTTAGEFDIAIDPITVNETNANFTCDDGKNLNSTFIKVLADYSINRSVTTLLTNQTKFTVNTECIEKIDVSEVKLSWVLFKNNQTVPITNSSTSVIHIFTDEQICLADKYCGGSAKARKASTLTILEDNDATSSYYIGIQVVYTGTLNERTFTFTDRSYKIKDTSGPVSGLSIGAIIGIVVGIIAFLVIIIVIVVIFVLKGKKSAGMGSDSKKGSTT